MGHRDQLYCLLCIASTATILVEFVIVGLGSPDGYFYDNHQHEERRFRKTAEDMFDKGMGFVI